MYYYLILLLYFTFAFYRNFSSVWVFVALIEHAKKAIGISHGTPEINDKHFYVCLIGSVVEVYLFHNLMQYYLVFHKL